MKRLFPLLIVVGCAVQRKEAAPATTPSSAPAEHDGTGSEPAPSTGVDKPSAAPMPGGGATGTVVLSPEVQKAQANFDSASTAFSAAGNDCAQLCKALSSMSNATDRLCELASTDVRCSDAKTKLDAARARVKSTCGTC
jgi:hypothetical protein